jgi:predicted RNA-binding protein with PIN domain
MPVLIDGHNLIGHLSTTSLDDPDDEEVLVRMLRAYRARTGKGVTVVFDPGTASSLRQKYRSGGVEVIFARHGSTADAVIIQRLRKSENTQSFLLITSDRELASQAMRLGARVQNAGEFAEQLEGPAAQPPSWREQPLPADEVQAWLAIFESDDHGDTLDDTD